MMLSHLRKVSACLLAAAFRAATGAGCNMPWQSDEVVLDTPPINLMDCATLIRITSLGAYLHKYKRGQRSCLSDKLFIFALLLQHQRNLLTIPKEYSDCLRYPAKEVLPIALNNEWVRQIK